MRLAVVSSLAYSDTTTLSSQLDTIHAATPVTLLSTYRLSTSDQAALAWAQKNAVPWDAMWSTLDAIGAVDASTRASVFFQQLPPDQLLTAGSGYHVSSAAAIAKARGFTVTQI